MVASAPATFRTRPARGDVMAGVTVAAYLIPQVMACAQLAGLPPAAGLWSALVASLVYVALGSAPLVSTGPESPPR